MPLLVVAGLLLGGVAAMFLFNEPSVSAGEELDWPPALEGRVNRAVREDRLVLLDFYATWCGPCQMMDRTVFPDSNVKNALADWVVIKIDVDKQPDVARHYRISGMPTFVALTPGGQVVDTVAGAMPAPAFVRWIESVEQDR